MDPPVQLLVRRHVLLHAIVQAMHIPISVKVFALPLHDMLNQQALDALVDFVHRRVQKVQIGRPHQPSSLGAQRADRPLCLLGPEDAAVVADPVARRHRLVYACAIAVLVRAEAAALTVDDEVVFFIVLATADDARRVIILDYVRALLCLLHGRLFRRELPEKSV